MSNKTILFADDSATMRQIVEKTFAAEPFTVVGVPSGEGAVTKAKELKPDVIIVDAGMPGVSGYDVCNAVRSDPVIKSTPVVIMSGVSSLYDDARGRNVGVTEHVKKPFDTGLLIELIGSITASASPVQDVALEEVEEPEDLPLEPISEPPLPEPAPLPLSSAAARSPAAAFPGIERPYDRKSVGKETRDYARPSSPPVDVHVGAPLSAQEDEGYGEEVDFGDDADDFPETDTTSDVPPIEIDARGDDADSASFHVGTLAELAQMDAKGTPLRAEPHEDAIELTKPAPAASTLASLGPKLSKEPTAEPPVVVGAAVDVSNAPKPKGMEVKRSTAVDISKPRTVVVPSAKPREPAPVSPRTAAPTPSVKVSAAVDAGASSAASKIVESVEGITPAQAAAIQTLTREIIERVVWEVVPDLAEVIIKEELAKLLEE